MYCAMTAKISKDLNGKCPIHTHTTHLLTDFTSYDLELSDDMYLHCTVCTDALGNPKKLDKKNRQRHLRTATHRWRKALKDKQRQINTKIDALVRSNFLKSYLTLTICVWSTSNLARRQSHTSFLLLHLNHLTRTFLMKLDLCPY